MKKGTYRFDRLLLLLLAMGLSFVGLAAAHCDTEDGPVAKDVRRALESGKIDPALKWVQADQEPQVKSLFEKALVVRTKGPEAQELADRYFLETVMLLHRTSEGAPFTGIKPAGTKLEPGVAEADRALETGSVEELVKPLDAKAAAEVRKRFADTYAKKKIADSSVTEGRAFVKAYVGYVHFVEKAYAGGQPEAIDHHAGHGSETSPAHDPAHGE
jgi:hypothetical protein